MSIKDAVLKPESRVLVRADLDVPLEKGEIVNTYRIDKCLPTFHHILDSGASLIIATKLGSPKGKVVQELSTKFLKPYLDEKLGERNYELLENTRFDPREEASDLDYAKELAEKADIYVNECFATSHRNDSTITQLPTLLDSYAGIRLAEEVSTLEKLLSNPQKPLVGIVGGAKIASKKPAIDKFLELGAHVLVGGKLGLDWPGEVPEYVHIPVDYAEDNKDIGEKTINEYCEIVQQARTVIWAGPLGYYEDPKFLNGTAKVGKAVAESNAYSIVGGGDSIAAFSQAGILEKFDFVSTGGGAMLQFLIQGNLPGLKALGYE